MPPAETGLPRGFLELFKGLPRAYSVFTPGEPVPQGEKQKGAYLTVHEEVTEKVWAEHLNGQHELGIIPIRDDGTCLFGCIDVDVYGLDVAAVEQRVRACGLPLVTCRTKSGGAHLFLFLANPIQSSTVRQTLGTWAVALGYAEVEIFPKQEKLADAEKCVGSSINIPYFHASMTTRYSLKDGNVLTAEEFLAWATVSRCTLAEIEAVKVPEVEGLEDGPPCLQCLAQAGFPNHTRNNGLFSLAVYCRLRYSDDWKSHVDGMNQRYLNPPLSSDEVAGLLKSVSKKKYFYKCNESPLIGVCNKQICLSRKYGIGEDTDDPGVAYGQLTKIDLDPPHWVAEVNGQQVDCGTAQLRSQDSFLTRCMEKLNILPRRVKKWDNQLRKWLENVIVQPAPPDAGPAGEIWSLIEEFCTGKSQGKSREDILAGKPYIKNGRTYFTSAALRRFFNSRNVKVPMRDVWKVINSNGGENDPQKKIKGKNLSLWSVPTFGEQTEAFDIPGLGLDGDI